MNLINILKKKKKVLRDINHTYVFDKAKYHFDSVHKDDLDNKQAYVHTGLYFAWIIKNDLVSDLVIKEDSQEIELTKQEKVLPCHLYKIWDGVLLGELLNIIGYNFSLDYFDFESGTYVNDYEKILCKDTTEFFKIEDTWENYYKISNTLDEKFHIWKKNYKL